MSSSHRNLKVAMVVGMCALWLGASASTVMAQRQGRPGRGIQPDQTMVKAVVGKPAPDFTLKDIKGKEHKLSDYAKDDKTVVLEWFNPDCPYVKKHHETHQTMANLYKEYKDKDVVWLAINSGAEGSATTGVDRNTRAVKELKIKYPILLDESGEIGRTYGATNTPHMYVVSSDGTLIYAGAIDSDNSPFRLGEVNYVKQALDQHLAGETVEEAKTKAYGCRIKYARR